MTGRTTRTLDRLTDASVLVIAAWTLAYHIAVVTRLPRSVALVLFVVLLATGAALLSRITPDADGSERAAPANRPASADAIRSTALGLTLCIATFVGLVYLSSRGGPTEIGITSFAVFAMVLLAVASVPVLRERSRSGARTWSGTGFAAGVVVGLVACAAGFAATEAISGRIRRPVIDAQWSGAFVVLCVAAAVLALLWAIRQRDPDAPVRLTRPLVECVLVILAAVAVATLIVVVRAPSKDDVHYVNQALYVGSHAGAFPLRDIAFGDQTYPSYIAYAAVESYTAFVGVLGWVTALDPRTVYFLVLAPLFGALAVLALWRLARTANSYSPLIVTAVGVAFILVHDRWWLWFGVHRIFQGKGIMYVFLVPWLWHHARSFAADGSKRSLVWLVTGGVAAMGLSATASFVHPVLIASALLPSVITASRPDRRIHIARLARGAASTVYPLAVGVGVAAVSAAAIQADHVARVETGEGPEFVARSAVEVWSRMMGSDAELAILVVVVLVSWLVVRDARLRTGIGSAVVFVTCFITPLGFAFANAIGLGGNSWRLLWVVPAPFLLGAIVDSARNIGGWKASVATIGVAAILLGAFAGGSRPILGSRQTAEYAAPSWDLEPDLLSAATRLVRLAEPGDIVAAPETVSEVIPQASARVFAASVTDRRTQAQGRLVGPRFHTDERLALNAVFGGGEAPVDLVERALRVLDVKAVCASPSTSASAEDVLEAAGFERRGADTVCTYWSRPGA